MAKKQIPLPNSNYILSLAKIHTAKKQMPNCQTVNFLPGKNPHGKENRSMALSNTQTVLFRRDREFTDTFNTSPTFHPSAGPQ